MILQFIISIMSVLSFNVEGNQTMSLFSKRPLLLALCIFILTTAISATVGLKIRIYCLSVITFVAVISLISSCIYALTNNSGKRTAFNTLLCVLFALIALLSSHKFFDRTLANAESYSDTYNITARIDECTYSASYTSVYTAKLLTVNEVQTDIYIELSSLGPTYYEKGDIISTSATFLPFSENNFGFNERNNNIASGILAYAEFESAQTVGKEENTLKYFFSDMRETLANRIDSGSLNASSGLIKALLLGERDDLENGTSLNFRRMGISHILSISGTHFTIILGMLAVLLSAFGFNKKAVYFILIFVALFYMGLTGFSESVCRAGIMSIIAYFGFLLGRTKDSYTALAIAVSVILLVSPYAVLSVSLWLSFIATLTILIINDLTGSLKSTFKNLGLCGKILFAIVTNLLISTFISIITLPIVAAVFGEISAVAPIANLVVVPLISLLLYLGPFCIIFHRFYPITYVCDLLYDFIKLICDYICGFDNLLISLNHSFVVPISVLSCIAMLIMLAIPLRKRLLVLLPPVISIILIAACIFVFNHFLYDLTNVTYFTQGGNDGIVITDRSETLCIDISTGASSAAYRAEHISEQNYSPEISAFMFTHCHSLHISMFTKLCSRTNIHSVFLPRTNNDSNAFIASIAEVAAENGVKIVWFDYDKPIKFNGTEITVLEPVFISRSTHPVICLKISSKDNDMLYLGSSFNDTKLDYTSSVAKAEYIIYGQHSPIAKNSFDFKNNATCIYGNSSIAALSPDAASDIILDKNGEYVISLK